MEMKIANKTNMTIGEQQQSNARFSFALNFCVALVEGRGENSLALGLVSRLSLCQ